MEKCTFVIVDAGNSSMSEKMLLNIDIHGGLFVENWKLSTKIYFYQLYFIYKQTKKGIHLN